MGHQVNHILLTSVQRLLRRKAGGPLSRILERSHAADIATLFRGLSQSEALNLFGKIADNDKRAAVLAEADPEHQDLIVDTLQDDVLVALLERMQGDDAADILERLPEDRAIQILAKWKSEDAEEIDTLLGYHPDSAGGIMSPDVFALTQETTVAEAIETLQMSHEDLEMAFYLYVVNEGGQLVGVCSLRQLVVSIPETPLQEIMATDIVSVGVDTDQEEVARLVARYNFLAVPVTDSAGRLVGVVTVDDIIDVIREEATEDMFKMAGAGALDFADQATPLRSAKQRLPWLLASFFGGVVTMIVISQFEHTIERAAALAAFIPITLGMGGNVGTQSSTIVTRGLALGRINASRFRSVVLGELAVGVLCGLAYGVLLGLIALIPFGGTEEALAYEPWQLAATVSLGIASAMVIAATVGGGIPLLFDRMGFDPAVATGPFVTTAVDMLGTLIYFAIGQSLLGL